MADFLQQVVAGLASGGVYGSLALALVLIYRSTRVINFAQGEMATCSTYIAWSLLNHGMPYWAAFFLTLAISFVGGVAIERIVIRPVEGASVLTNVIITLGLALLVNGLTTVIWGTGIKQIRSAFPTRPIHVGGVAFSIQDIGITGVSIAAVVLLFALFQYTKTGLALRAASFNPASSRLVGIRVGWMLALGWGLAAVLGAVSGLLVAPVVFLDPNMMQTVLLYAFAAAILGGLDSPIGAVVGGLALGVTLNLLGTYVGFVGATLRLPVAVALILAVLLVRPAGLFGRVAVRRV
ncbi:MAG: branched-chain amino acid transport system permease protein [Gaiellaceae bacterium]|jgi:branched-chain amino acid transport system permease protein|nr:branched-chain amino acid transport system permease protein [Gaiellaceae bacterium]